VDRSLPRLRELDDIWGGRVHTVFSTKHAIEELAVESDLIVGAVLIAGAAAPKLVSAETVKRMAPGSVMVDISIDQGGCFETSHPTTHADPTYVVDDVVHYCVANMPGAVARTSTIALGNATMPYMLALADKGWRQACIDDPHLMNGLNVHAGKLTYYAVGKALSIDVTSPSVAVKQ
jgi:alanine dehydrogenase